MFRITINKDEVKIRNNDTKKMLKTLRSKTIDPICMGVGAGIIVREAVKAVTGSDTLGDALGLIAWYKTTARRLEEANRR